MSEYKDALPGSVVRREQEVLEDLRDFQDPKQEWRRLVSELYGLSLIHI